MQRAAHKHQKALEEAAERAEAEKAEFRQKSSEAAAAAVAATEERLRTTHDSQCAICFLSLPHDQTNCMPLCGTHGSMAAGLQKEPIAQSNHVWQSCILFLVGYPDFICMEACPQTLA